MRLAASKRDVPQNAMLDLRGCEFPTSGPNESFDLIVITDVLYDLTVSEFEHLV